MIDAHLQSQKPSRNINGGLINEGRIITIRFQANEFNFKQNPFISTSKQVKDEVFTYKY